jgi:hypothetical protein
MFQWLRRWIRSEGLLVLVGGPLFAAIASHDKRFQELTLVISAVGCVSISRLKWGEKAEERAKQVEEKWERLEPKRQRAAKIILDNPDNPADISEDIIDFFNDLGSALEDHEMRKSRIYCDYSIYIQYYWETCYGQVIGRQKGDESDVWTGFYLVYNELVKKRGNKPRTKEQIVEFFKGEMAD